ncbi:MAG: hypothetical protein JWM64_152 [Frankiales bacterium]|nr:hypothetical protein [Frankiales bacterium]
MLHYLVALQILVTDRVEKVKNDRGATAVEYGLMVALIAAIVVVAAGALGHNVSEKFSSVCTSVKGTATGGTNC